MHELIKQKEIRQVMATAMVDTGAGTLIINEEVRQKLGLDIIGLRFVTLGNNTKKNCKVTEPVQIQWNDRLCNCSALVVPGTDEVLLGAIPFEDMDLMVNPAGRNLVGAHGDDVVCMVK
ncbi:hypothetical protein FACS1894172_19470 [Spirochaetia bacterium]|nr:hypothetical protein FACS1894164_12540 [Spirochaetia bacterium]GHU36516.1 hypothetical protein FACS1894172_19470 [Spirochaetia bacterium]